MDIPAEQLNWLYWFQNFSKMNKQRIIKTKRACKTRMNRTLLKELSFDPVKTSGFKWERRSLLLNTSTANSRLFFHGNRTGCIAEFKIDMGAYLREMKVLLDANRIDISYSFLAVNEDVSIE